MKISHLILLSAAMLVSTTGLFAQNNDTPLGYVARQAEFKIADMYDFSRFNTNLGTARSAAMAGAFTSLGADLSSMNINPAGLGMYRTTEYGITASLLTTGIKNSAPGLGSTTASRTNVGLNNIGVAFNVYEGSGAVTSFSFGINYNKLADFNYRSTINVARTSNSILDMFRSVAAAYANDVDAGVDALSSTTIPWGAPNDGGAYLHEWGGVLAFQTNLIQYDEANDRFLAAIDGNTEISHYMNTVSKGSVGEYTFSGGWNFSNTLYFGFSLGVLDYYSNRLVTYSENYSNNNAQEIPPALGMIYNQRMRTVGDGYNLKLGFIVRPTTELRIGVAYHSPSIVTLKNTYSSDMRGLFSDGEDRAWPPTVTFTERFYTPSRFLAGVSYIIGERAIIALDYEHAWYNGMGVRGNDYGDYKEWYRQQVKEHFTGAHTVRLGGEVQAADNLFVRAGGSYVREGVIDDLRNGNLVLDVPIDKSSFAISAGLGYNFSASTSLDLTYVYTATQNTLYYPYLYNSTAENATFRIGDAPFEITRNRHNIMLSLSHRF